MRNQLKEAMLYHESVNAMENAEALDGMEMLHEELNESTEFLKSLGITDEELEALTEI